MGVYFVVVAHIFLFLPPKKTFLSIVMYYARLVPSSIDFILLARARDERVEQLFLSFPLFHSRYEMFSVDAFTQKAFFIPRPKQKQSVETREKEGESVKRWKVY